MQISLAGRSALITGGSAGLGKAMATVFHSAGANVAIVARREDVLAAAREDIIAAGKATGSAGAVHCYSGDVSKADDITSVYGRAVADMGQVDIMVNNAGTSQTGKFEEITDAVWQADLDLKLMAAIRFARLAMPDMRGRKWGRILNILNIGAKAPSGGSAPTTVSRAAGMALTKVLAHEGAPHNVLVNALLVGFFDSEQWTRRHANLNRDIEYHDYLDEMAAARKIPVGRVGEAAEFANMACFLASDAASYVTGTAINVDGGAAATV